MQCICRYNSSLQTESQRIFQKDSNKERVVISYTKFTKGDRERQHSIVQTEMVNYCTDMSALLYGTAILSALLWRSVFIVQERERVMVQYWVTLKY